MLPEEWLYAAGRVALKIRTGGSGRAGILIMQMKTNYRDLELAKQKADILYRLIKKYF